MAGPSLMDSLFQRSLEDLIKGIRLHSGAGAGESSTFISKCLDEIRREIKATDPQTKTTALQKLTYLHSLHGVDMSWAAFHSIELSSSTNFHSKRIAYLAASLSFNPSTEVILLLTHQLRKDLSSANPHEVSLALQTLSSICTPDLARDLTPELFTLLNSNKGFIKRKAIATVLKFFELYPDSVRVCFKRLVENLESSDPGVVSAVVGVFCELAVKEPRSYLPLAPEFYKILVDSRNNWVLIKVLKIFAKLAPLEPRLGKRVVEPICEHLKRTEAKSLAFECIRTILTALSQYEAALKLAVGKVREFLVEDDPNLKYLGLQALAIVGPKYLDAILENKEMVIKSLSDDDVNIKLEALKLVMAMVSEDNITEICRVLMNYAIKSDPDFCNEILGSILSTCSRNYYEMIIDFDWYVLLLGEMSRVPHCQKGQEIENQLVDIGMRVRDVRPELVRVGRDLLIDPALLGNPFIHRILAAAAWVSGEYVEFSKNPFELMEALLQPRTNLLPPSIRAIYIQSSFKVLAYSAYSYFFPDEVVAQSSHELAGSLHNVESSDYLSGAAVTDTDPDQSFNPRMPHESLRDNSVDKGKDIITDCENVPTASLKMDRYPQDSFAQMLNIVDMTFTPLLGCHEVEILDRVTNVLGLVELIRLEIRGCEIQKEVDNVREELKAAQVIRLMHNAFSEELGPVSLMAQERVPLPDGLELKENLSDIDEICGNFTITISSSFNLERPWSREKDAIILSEHQNKEVVEQSNDSTSVLTEHRKRHGLYYLPSEEKETVSSDYPPANDLSLPDKTNDQTDDLFKLTEQSLVPKKKPTAKPRPVVVKLDDGNSIHIVEKKPEMKEHLISDAVRDVLLGNDAAPSSSRTTKSDKLSSRVTRKDLLVSATEQDSTTLGRSDKNSRRNKHRSHGKEKSHKSSTKVAGDPEEKSKPKSSHSHGKHKSRQRANSAVNVAAQSPVIPDFLL
ncbi:OLC1v1014153C1 [Oldenlandia corymbosa var. corymbosa]|uniref:AP-3 complex subunit delta n=1 Tax=Oldenlandia corymbosa var. corymbosa TaxID=529605 RepID=A0AAV1E0W6_OLDCO|nr:OLC1v1014153C1 [Oldenlandia corymbosa var. corymbosa]